MTRTILPLLILTALFACASKEPMQDTKVEMASIKPVTLPGMSRVHMARGALLGSQPDATALKLAHKKYGTKTVLNLRMPAEIKYFMEAQAVRDFGMEYHNVAFAQASTLTDEVFSRALAVLRDQSKAPVLMHCKSGNRVGAIWYAHLVLDLGVLPDEAMAEAKIVGLRKKGHIMRAMEYVDAMRK